MSKSAVTNSAIRQSILDEYVTNDVLNNREYVAHGEIDRKSFDDTYTFGTTPNTIHINQNPQHINGKVVSPVPTDVLLNEAPTALVSSDGLAPAGLSKYDFVVTEPQELVTNGTFDVDTSGWTAGSGGSGSDALLSVVNGRLRVTNTATSNIGWASIGVSTVIGCTYRLTYSLTHYNTACDVSVGTVLGHETIIDGVNLSEGVRTDNVTFAALTTTTYITCRNIGAGDGVYSDFDNISVQPVDQIFQLTEDSYTTSEALLSSANFTSQESVYREDSIWLRDDATYLAIKGQATPDGYSEVGGEYGLWSDGTNYAVPVTDVLRKRNLGAYSNVFNKTGTMLFGDSLPWYSTTDSVITVADCFTTIGTTGGSPDNLDASLIYEHDLLDRRMSAKEPTDKVQLLTDSMQDLVDGLVRGEGFSGQVTITEFTSEPTITISGATVVEVSTAYGFDNWRLAIPIVARTLDTSRTHNHATAPQLHRNYLISVVGDNGSSLLINGINHIAYAGIKAYLVLLDKYEDSAAAKTDFDTLFPLGTTLTFSTVVTSDTAIKFASTIRRCALIGDPANYYRGKYDFLSSDGVQTIVGGTVIRIAVGSEGNTGYEGTVGHYYKLLNEGSWTEDIGTVTQYSLSSVWQDLGPDREDSWLLEGNTLDAEPLLVAEDGSSLIPDGTSTSVKLPHKASELLGDGFYSDNGGRSWFTATRLFNSLDNIVEGLMTVATRLWLIFYNSPTTPLIDYVEPDKVISESTTVIASDSSRMVDYVTDKVATGTDEEKLTVLKDKSGVVTHHPSDLGGAGPAAKLFGNLVNIGGRGYVEVCSKELVYDDGKNSWLDSDTKVITAGDPFTYQAGVLLWLQGFTNGLFEDGIFQLLVDVDDTWSTTFLEGYSILSTGEVVSRDGSVNQLIKLWDGNGWGDDNTLDATETTTTEIDDNGQTIRITKSLVPLNVYLGDS